MKVIELVEKFKSEGRADISKILMNFDLRSEVRIDTVLEITAENWDRDWIRFSATRDFYRDPSNHWAPLPETLLLVSSPTVLTWPRGGS